MPRSIHDGQAMFDVSLQAAHGRITELHQGRGRPAGRPARHGTARHGLRYALGVRLLAAGAALVADEPLVPRRRRLARG